MPTSLVAEKPDGTVVGFIMGQLFMGEYGIFEDEANLDTIGVDPDCQKQGIGEMLVNEYMDHLKELGVRKVNTLVDRNDAKMLHFLNSNQFSASTTIVSLERIL